MLELNKIYNGNAINLLKELDDSSIDMVITSPPYDSMREYDGIVWNFEIFKLIAQELKRVLKDGGVIIWVVGDQTIKGSETGTSFRQAFGNKGLKGLIEQIKKDYNIKEPYLTLREYINSKCCGAYHTFHFTLKNVNVSIDTIGDMLTDELCSLYPLTNNFYVLEDETESNDGNCENYHCDHYLKLEPKED